MKERRLRPDVLRDLRYAAEILAILAAGAWAFYTFFYEERIKPLTEPGVINESITEKVERGQAGTEFVTFFIRLENPSRRTMDVAAESYNVYGVRVVTKPPRQDFSKNKWTIFPALHLADEQLVASTGTLRLGAGGSGRILLRPGGSAVETTTVVVPRNRYAALDFYWTIYHGLAPIEPTYALTARRRADGAIVIDGRAPHDDGVETVVL